MRDRATPEGRPLPRERRPQTVSEPPAAHGREVAERYAFRWPGKAAAARLAESAAAAEVVPPLPPWSAETVPHLVIEGDNLAALKLLAATYAEQVQLIYIDPPYNTGNEFTFTDHYAESLRTYRRVAGAGGPVSAEMSGRRHARWLSMLYPRLVLAHQLLRPDGALCLSIGEEEVHHARLLLDEIFGEEHHRNTLAVRRRDKNLSRQFMARGMTSLAVGFEYVLIYARSARFTMRPIFRESSPRRQTHGYWKGFWNSADRPTMRYPLLGVLPERGQWKWQESVARAAVRNYAEYLAHFAQTLTLEAYWEQSGQSKRFIRRQPEGRGHNQGVEHWIPPSTGILRSSDWTDLLASESLRSGDLSFDNPKSRVLIESLLRLCGQRDSLVLDFFAGSGTTGHAVLSLNAADGGQRRFILVQQPEPTGDPTYPTISAITRERLRRALRELPAQDERTAPEIRELVVRAQRTTRS